MRAAVMDGKVIEVRTLPDPIPGPGQILVAPIATGICGSDLHFREQVVEAVEQGVAMPPIVPGHEFSGTIVEVGSGVDGRFKAGAIVTANPFTHGAEGPECVGLSTSFSGGLATLSRVDAIRSILVPESVPPHLAALTEPLAVGLRAASLADRNPGPNLVIGCGPVGLAVIFALRAAGRGPILAADYSAPRRRAAEALGADIVIDPAVHSPFERWSDLAFTEAAMSPLLEGTFDRPVAPNIFECVGARGLIDQITAQAPQHSHIIVVGVCAHQDHFVPLNGIQKELTLEFSFAYTMVDFQESLARIAQSPDQVEHLVSSRLPLDQTAAAFDALASDPEEVKVLVHPQEG